MHGDQEDIEELFIFARVNEDVDGRIENEGKVIDMDKDLDPIRPVVQVPVVQHQIDLVAVDDGPQRVADDEDDHDENEHHGDAVVPPLVGGDSVVQARGLTDGSEDERVQDDQDREGDGEQRQGVGDDHVVAAVARVGPEGGGHQCRQVQGVAVVGLCGLVPLGEVGGHHLCPELEEARNVEDEGEGHDGDGVVEVLDLLGAVGEADGEVPLDADSHSGPDGARQADLDDGQPVGGKPGTHVLVVVLAPAGDGEQGEGEGEEGQVESGQHLQEVSEGGLHVEVAGGQDLDGDEVAEDAKDAEGGHHDALDEEDPVHLEFLLSFHAWNVGKENCFIILAIHESVTKCSRSSQFVRQKFNLRSEAAE